MGAGIVGGTLMSIDDLSRDTADVAVRLLNGASPSSIRRPPQLPGQPIFDWRELQRWGIPESRLPPGSVVRYRPPSVWREYRGTVLSASRRAGHPVAPDHRAAASSVAPGSGPRSTAGGTWRSPPMPVAAQTMSALTSSIGT